MLGGWVVQGLPSRWYENADRNRKRLGEWKRLGEVGEMEICTAVLFQIFILVKVEV